MGIQTLIISVAFLLFAIIFIVPVLGNIDDVQKGGLICAIIPQVCDTTDKDNTEKENKEKAKVLGNNPQSGDQVCDLKVTINGELDISSQNASELYFTIPFTENNLHVWINDKIENTPPISAKWFCDANSTTSISSIFDLNTLDISGFALGDSFTLKLSGLNQDEKYLVDGNDNIEWKKKIIVKDGDAITVPYAFSHEFVLSDVKADNYTLKLVAENKQLNDGLSNSSVEYKVFAPWTPIARQTLI